MLRSGMTVDVSDGTGCTALHFATRFNRTNVIKHLLREGADVNRQDRIIKNTPLHWAICRNYTEVIRILIDNGADVNIRNEINQTPLDKTDKGTEAEGLLLQLQQKHHKGTVNRKSLLQYFPLMKVLLKVLFDKKRESPSINYRIGNIFLVNTNRVLRSAMVH